MKVLNHLLSSIIVACLLFSNLAQANDCIGVITAGGGKGFWGDVKKGGVEAGKELGINVYVLGTNDEFDIATELELINYVVGKGCRGLVLAPHTPQRKALIAQLKKRGILTVFVDRDIGGERLSVLKTDNFEAGKLAGKEMVKALKGKGKVAILRYNQGVSTTTAREMGFRQEVLASGLDVFFDEYIGTTVGSARKSAFEIFSNSHDVDGIFTSNESTTMGAIAALKMLNKTGKMTHIGFDSSEFIINALMNQQIYGFVAQKPFVMGYQGVLSVYQAMQGEKIKADIDTGVTFVDQDNISTPLIKKLLDLP